MEGMNQQYGVQELDNGWNSGLPWIGNSKNSQSSGLEIWCLKEKIIVIFHKNSVNLKDNTN